MRGRGALILAVAAFLACLFLLPANAGAAKATLSAIELRDMCTSKMDVDYGFCAGYVTAVAHTMLDQGVAGQKACNHSAVRSQQFVDTFNTWADLFPDRLNASAEAAVAEAMARAFPCGTR